MSRFRVAVIGAGVIGLSTAVCIQEELGSTADVTIIADKFDEEIVSSVAAALLYLGYNAVNAPLHVARRWAQDSYDQFFKLAHSSEGGTCGVSVHWVNDLYREKPKNNKITLNEDIYYRLSEMSVEELAHFPGYSFGRCSLTAKLEPRKYLPWLLRKFKSSGGRVEVRKISSLASLVGKYDVVVTCCGLGAKSLLGDENITSARGQVIRVKAPWIKSTYFYDDGYIIPGEDYTTIGGVFQEGVYDETISSKDTEEIWEKATKFMPSLKNAEWVNVKVGLRPYRNPIRVEVETMTFSGGNLKVVHNYGHGGHGYGLSWGSAKHATELVSLQMKQSKL